MFEVKKHLLHRNDEQVPFVESPNGGSSVRPLYLIIHYTAGTTASSAVNWFKNPQAKASAHLVIDRDGAITQMRPFNKSAWHAGKSKWGDIDGLNGFSIGIELVNAGKLKRDEAGHWLTWSNQKIKNEEVILATHRHETSPAGWHIYPQEQLEVLETVGTALNEAYAFLDILGHDDISPGRKVDPGPAFPLITVQSHIFGRV